MTDQMPGHIFNNQPTRERGTSRAVQIEREVGKLEPHSAMDLHRLDTGSAGEVRQVTVLSLASVFLRRPRALVFPPLFGLIGAVALGLLIQESTAESAFMPMETEGASQLAGLAAQFGVAGLFSGSAPALPYYARVLRSGELLRDVVLSEFRGPAGHSQNLIGIFGVSGDDDEERLAEGIDELRSRLSMETDIESGIITLRTRAPTDELAEAINRRLLDALNEFNLNIRQFKAREERQFIEKRTVDSREALEQVEQSMEDFLAKNRTYQSSPALVFQAARLQRQIDLRQQVYTGLAQAHEQARIEEVRNTPVILTLDSPEGSAELSPSPVIVGIAGLALGLFLGVCWIIFAEAIRVGRSAAPEEYDTVRRLVRSAARRLFAGSHAVA